MKDGFDVQLLDGHILRFKMDGSNNFLYSPSCEGSYEQFLTIYNSVYILDQYMARGRISPGDVVIDCGAHIGIFSLLASQCGGFVVAVEPLKLNLTCLELLSGRYKNICLVPGVVYDCNQEIMFTLENSNSTASGRVSPDGEALVMAMKIDTIAERLGLQSVDFIKMDTEGAEIPALMGAEETITKYGPELAITAYHKENDPTVIRSLIKEIRDDYKIFISQKLPFCELILYASTTRSENDLRDLFKV